MGYGRPEGNTDPWFVLHRIQAHARVVYLVLQYGSTEHPAVLAARARLSYYTGEGLKAEMPWLVARAREAGREGYENRSWRSHHSSPTPALPQYNDSDAKRKGES